MNLHEIAGLKEACQDDTAALPWRLRVGFIVPGASTLAQIVLGHLPERAR